MSIFPPMYKGIVHPDELRPNLSHVYVKDGYFYGTNSVILFKIPISAFESPFSRITSLEHTKGKAFSYELLKEMSKAIVERINFTETTVELYFRKTSKTPNKIYFYSAALMEDREYQRIDEKGELIFTEIGDKIFPSAIYAPPFDAVIPKAPELPKCVEMFGIDGKELSILQEILQAKSLKLTFSNVYDVDGITSTSRAILVHPYETILDGAYGIIMPCLIKDQ